MKITELRNEILDTLHDKKFVGNFEITIYHEYMEHIKIHGFKEYVGTFPVDFDTELQLQINDICFKIVSGLYTSDGYDFSILGQTEYLFDSRHPEENDETI